jgi:hypothetical protein
MAFFNDRVERRRQSTGNGNQPVAEGGEEKFEFHEGKDGDSCEGRF